MLAALLAMRLPARDPAQPRQHVLHELREGFATPSASCPSARSSLLLAVVNLAAMPLTVLLPIFATTVLHGGPDTLGLLTSALGFGSLLGAC